MRVGEVRYYFRIEIPREGREVSEDWEPILGDYPVIQARFLPVWFKWIGEGEAIGPKEAPY